MNDNLIVENIKLINFAIKDMGCIYNFDDYYEIGLIALVNAGRTFDETKGYKFANYAITCIKNEISKYIRLENYDKRKANYKTVSLYNKVTNESETTFIDVLPSKEDTEKEVLRQEKIKLLKTIIFILEPNDRFMLEHYFELWGKQKMNQTEIAKKLGVDQRYVSYRIKRSMRIIKKIMEDKYEKN